MKKYYLLLILCSSFCCKITAQQKSNKTSAEFGFAHGLSSYLGDLIASDAAFSQAGSTAGLFYRQNINYRISVKFFANHARIKADDKLDNTDINRRRRNLSFRSDIFEAGATFEYSILRFNSTHPKRKSKKMLYNASPYFFTGMNLFYFNPKTLYRGEWVRLQPLTTEGISYRLTQLAIPFGIGLKYQATSHLIFGIELGARKTFTDYLDDVSTTYPDLEALTASKGELAAELSYRGDERDSDPNYNLPAAGKKRGESSNKDWYLINQISVCYKNFNKKNKF